MEKKPQQGQSWGIATEVSTVEIMPAAKQPLYFQGWSGCMMLYFHKQVLTTVLQSVFQL